MKRYLLLLLLCLPTVGYAQYPDVPQMKTFTGSVRQVKVTFLIEDEQLYMVNTFHYGRDGNLLRVNAVNKSVDRVDSFHYDNQNRITLVQQTILDFLTETKKTRVVHYHWLAPDSCRRTTIANDDTLQVQTFVYKRDGKGRIAKVIMNNRLWAAFEYYDGNMVTHERFYETDFGSLNTILIYTKPDKHGNPTRASCHDESAPQYKWKRTYIYTYYK